MRERCQATPGVRWPKPALLRPTPGNFGVPDTMRASPIRGGMANLRLGCVRALHGTRGRRWGRRCSKHRSTHPTASHTPPDADRTRPSTDPVGRSRPVPWRASPLPPSAAVSPGASRPGCLACEHKKQKHFLVPTMESLPNLAGGLDTDESSLSRSGDRIPPAVSELGGRAGRREGRDGQ